MDQEDDGPGDEGGRGRVPGGDGDDGDADAPGEDETSDVDLPSPNNAAAAVPASNPPATTDEGPFSSCGGRACRRDRYKERLLI